MNAKDSYIIYADRVTVPISFTCNSKNPKNVLMIKIH